jgi:NTE family protein
MSNLGLVLSGGGARGAYQAGVLVAISEIAQKLGVSAPFPILSGVSAGSINATILAGNRESFLTGAQSLANMWSEITTDSVFYADLLTLSRGGLDWMSGFSPLKVTKKETPAKALFSTTPLRSLLSQVCNFNGITENISEGRLRGISLSALEYDSVSIRTFFDGAADLKNWERPMHRGERCKLSVDHVMASTAIPLLFPPVKIDHRYYGDGCIRNQSPCAPAINMGAECLIAIGVRRKLDTWYSYHHANETASPSMAKIINVIFHSMMMDGLESDIQRISQTNIHLQSASKEEKRRMSFREVESLWIAPTVDFAKLASQKGGELPRMIRYLLTSSGNLAESSELISYLLFDPSYCKELVEIGFGDGMKERANIERILEPPKTKHFKKTS